MDRGDWWAKKKKKKTDSFCYIAETNTTLQLNYTPTKKVIIIKRQKKDPDSHKKKYRSPIKASSKGMCLAQATKIKTLKPTGYVYTGQFYVF